MKVPLHFVNAEKSPGVKEQGGVVSHVLNELDITCLPDDLPEFIEVDLSNLAVGNSVHARDLVAAQGRRGGAAQGREPGGRHLHPAGADRRGRGRGDRSGSGRGRRADHGAGRAREGGGSRRGRQGARPATRARTRRPTKPTRPPTRPTRKTRSNRWPRSASSSAWATRARSTSAPGTTPGSGWWSASPLASGIALRKDPKYQALVGQHRRRRLAAAAADAS